MWHYGKNVVNANEKSVLNQIVLGSAYQVVYSDAIDLQGEMSELNIWSTAIPLKDLMEITKNCGDPKISPDVLKWSEMSMSMILGDSIKQEISELCFHGTNGKSTHKLIPYQRNQDEALFVCKNLNGQLAYPKNIEEYSKWQGEFH